MRVKSQLVAFFDMATEDRRAANLDGAHDAQLLERKLVGFPVSEPCCRKMSATSRVGRGIRSYFRGFGFGLTPSASRGLGVPAITWAETFV